MAPKKPISLDKIADAIHKHVVQGTFDADYPNARLWPATRVTIAVNDAALTPMNTPQEDNISSLGSASSSELPR